MKVHLSSLNDKSQIWPVRAVLVWFLLAFVIRLSILLQDMSAIDRLFLPDDTYYSLSIARNIAMGQGTVASAGILTNGFQPLITFLQAPFFLFEFSLDQAVQLAVIESAFFGACASAALGSLLSRISSRRAGWFGATFMALNPRIITNDLNALETSLAGLLAILMLHLLLSCLRRPDTRNLCLLGLTYGLSILARIDNCCLVAITSCIIFVRHGPRPVIIPALAALSCVLPWWLYSWHNFGIPIPESGAAVRQIALSHIGPNFTLVVAVGLGLHAVGELFIVSQDHPVISRLVGLGLLISLLAYSVKPVRSRTDRNALICIMAIVSLICFLFYTLYLPAAWFFGRYLAFIYIAGLTTLSMCLANINQILPSSLRRQTHMTSLLSIVLACGVGLFWLTSDSRFLSPPLASQDNGVEGNKGYREVALEILARLPPDARLGAMQSGALGYYAPSSTEIFNLDGVVNGTAYRALRDNTVGAYLSSNNITYFADWPLNVRFLEAHYGDSAPAMHMAALFSAERQGGEQTTLYKLDIDRHR